MQIEVLFGGRRRQLFASLRRAEELFNFRLLSVTVYPTFVDGLRRDGRFFERHQSFRDSNPEDMFELPHGRSAGVAKAQRYGWSQDPAATQSREGEGSGPRTLSSTGSVQNWDFHINENLGSYGVGSLVQKRGGSDTC